MATDIWDVVGGVFGGPIYAGVKYGTSKLNQQEADNATENYVKQSKADARTAEAEADAAKKEADAADKAAKAAEKDAKAQEKAAAAAEKAAAAAKKSNESAAKLADANATAIAKQNASESAAFDSKLQAVKPFAIGGLVIAGLTGAFVFFRR